MHAKRNKTALRLAHCKMEENATIHNILRERILIQKFHMKAMEKLDQLYKVSINTPLISSS